MQKSMKMDQERYLWYDKEMAGGRLTVDNMCNEENLPLLLRKCLMIFREEEVVRSEDRTHAGIGDNGESLIILETNDGYCCNYPHNKTVDSTVYTQRAPEFPGYVIVFGVHLYVPHALCGVGSEGGEDAHVEQLGSDGGFVMYQYK